MNYKLLLIIVFCVLIVGIISGYFIFKIETHIDEKINTDISKSIKIKNISLQDFYDLKEKIPNDATMFYFYSDCPHFTEDVLIKDIQNNYYYLPEKNSVIIIHGKFEWTKHPPKSMQYHVYKVSST